MRFKKCGKFLARIVPVICVVCLVVSMAVPASAATINTYNYEDFITNTVTTTSGKIYTANLLRDNCYWRIYTGSNTSNLLSSGYGKNFTVSAMTGTEYTFVVDPASTNSYLDLSNIPLGTSLKLSYYLNADFSFITPTCIISVLYFDSNGSYLSRYDIELDKEGMSFPVEVAFPLNPPSGASVCRFQMKFTDIIPLPADGETNVVRDLYFVLNNFDLIIPVSNDYIINNNQQQTNNKLGELLDKQDQTNDKLNDLYEKQEQTNEKLDDIIEGTPEQNEEADEVEDKTDDALGDLESAGDALENVERPEIDADSLVPDQLFGDDYLLLVDTIKILWTSDIITDNITILAGFILLALVIHGKK